MNLVRSLLVTIFSGTYIPIPAILDRGMMAILSKEVRENDVIEAILNELEGKWAIYATHSKSSNLPYL
jgi:hypothetical protein